MALEPLDFGETPVSYRRYLLLKELACRVIGEEGLAAAWKGYRLERTTGTVLPANFPFKALLGIVGYTAVEDLAGATIDELTRYTQLGAADAEAVVRAILVILASNNA